MKENIKLHVYELFKRYNIVNTELEKELVNVLEEKYDSYYSLTHNEIIAFNRVISLINIEGITESNEVRLNKEKEQISDFDKKKIRKFSTYNYLISVIIYLTISLIFKVWTTSWAIFILSYCVDLLYRLSFYKEDIKNVLKIVIKVISNILAFISILIVSIGLLFSNYDYSFELIDDNVRYYSYQSFSKFNGIDINIINCDLIIETNYSSSISVYQYSKKQLPNKYLINDYVTYNLDENYYKLEVHQDKAPVFFGNKYYHSVVKILLPKEMANTSINICAISSDIEIDSNLSINEINIETTNGDISLNDINANKANLTTTNGKINIISSTLSETIVSSYSGNINISYSTLNEVKITSNFSDINLDNLKSEKIDINTTNSNIDLEKLNINNFKISSKDGSINASNISGIFDFLNEKGNISLSNIYIYEESFIKSNSGNILIEFNINSLYNLIVNNELGIIKNNYSSNNEGIKFNITNTSGNIEILLDN